MSLTMRTSLLLLSCLNFLANGRRMQTSAGKVASAFAPSFPGAKLAVSSPNPAGSPPASLNAQTLLQPPRSADFHHMDAQAKHPHMSSPGLKNLHPTHETRAEQSGRLPALTGMSQPESIESLEEAIQSSGHDMGDGRWKLALGVLASFVISVGSAIIFAWIYFRAMVTNISNQLQSENAFAAANAVASGVHPCTNNSTVPLSRPTRAMDISMCAPGSVVEIQKPDTHRREYGYVKLSNELQAIVGSDPNCDKAGAALCVNTGMCYERKDLPGLAHFLEHMLFTGTKKYPEESEYAQFVEQNGGSSNAYTTCFETNYMFEIKPDKLEEAVDRFSRFFYEPLLTRDCTEREINAVDSEFQQGMTSPWWRYVGIMNMSANKDHQWHVHCGNNDVLFNEPKERGVDLYDEMLKYYKDFYSANGMTLCIIGRESVEELKAMVSEKFSAVENKQLNLPKGDAVSSVEPFVKEDWNRLLLQSPSIDIKQLSFTWVVPYLAPLWKEKPSYYISHLLGHEGKGSITALLKERGLITGCSCGNGAWLEGAFSLVEVQFDLTDKGVNAVEEIGTVLFTYLGMLQQTPVQQSIFDEMRNLNQAQFKFSGDRNPFDLASQISENMQKYPASEALAGPSLLYEYNPDVIKELLAKLTLDGVRVTHCAKILEDRCTDKDTTYGSPMKFEPLDASWLEAWEAARTSNTASEIGLSLPALNPFIPEDLSVKELPAVKKPLPERLSDVALQRVYHKQDDTFLQPKADIIFLIRSPYITSDVNNFVKTELWCASLMEALNDFAYDAQVAGLNYVLSLNSGALMLRIGGFNDKLPELLQTVTSKMRSMTTVPANIYQLVADGYNNSVQNEAYHSQPISQLSQRYFELIVKGIGFPADERFRAFQGLTREDLDGVGSSILDSCHVEAMIMGNATADDAADLAEAFQKGLQVKGDLSSVPNRADAAFPPGSTLWRTDSMDDEDPNHAVRCCFQMESTPEINAKIMVLNNILSPKFFDVLRTQQQLGYIVGMGAATGTRFSYIIAQAQSEFNPDYVRSRMDAFFEEYFKLVLESDLEEEFQICLAGTLSELQTKPKNLNEELGQYMTKFSDRTFEYDYKERLIEELEKPLTLESLREFVRDVVLKAPKLYIQVKKAVDKPDKDLPAEATIPTDPEDLRCWTSREDAMRNFAPTAEWRPWPTAVE